MVICVGGAKVEVDLMALMQRRLQRRASTLRAPSAAAKAQVCAAVGAHVLPLPAGGTVPVPMAATFSLERAADAYERFAQGAKLGRIVLVPG